MAATLLAAAPAKSQECSGNPDAIGTSRVLTIEPGEVTRVGTMQYPSTLPLADHEIVLTFDDGPLPRYSNPILDILASQCVKATYFLIGEMAHAYPDVVQRIYAAGHTIGTHSETHPLRFGKLPLERMRAEIDDGIANVKTALGDPAALAPFFRVPGLESSETLENELAARSLIVFSADVVADDWHRRIKPDQIISRAISRLDERGKGILLLHDIHPATLAALPGLFKELKARGFHIVQVVPAVLSEPELLARATAQMVAWTIAGRHAADGTGGANWPSAVIEPMPDVIALPAPDRKSFDIGYALTPATSTGDVETAAQVADAVAPQPLAAASSQWPEPSMQNIGLPIAPPRLADAMDENGALGHAKLGYHDHAQRRSHGPAAHAAHATPAVHTGQRADLFPGARAVAALPTPRTFAE